MTHNPHTNDELIEQFNQLEINTRELFYEMCKRKILLLPTKEYMNDKELAAILGIPPATMRTWRSRGRGPKYVKADGQKGCVLYSVAEFEKWLKNREIKTIENDQKRTTAIVENGEIDDPYN
jgi:hypothetical protein